MQVRARRGEESLIAARVVAQFAADAAGQPLINAHVDARALAATIRALGDDVAVVRREGQLAGHLYGAVLSGGAEGTAVWTGPDGASFDDGAALHELLEHQRPRWRARGAHQHLLWTTPSRAEAWAVEGYVTVHHRGVRRLATATPSPTWPIRRATLADLPDLVTFSSLLDAAEGRRDSPSTALAEIGELLADPEVRYYLALDGATPIAQVITYPLEPRRGSFAPALHVSGVVVAPSYRGRGCARDLLDVALADAARSDFAVAEVTWRTSNAYASKFWPRLNFQPTYCRLAGEL